MNTLEAKEASQDSPAAPSRVKIRMLHQMAEALEDEAAGLCRRAATYEEEECLLKREIEERQTQINRLSLKAEALRMEHQGLMERVETICKEAIAIREEAVGMEDKPVPPLDGNKESRRWSKATLKRQPSHSQSADEARPMKPVFFHRMMLVELPG